MTNEQPTDDSSIADARWKEYVHWEPMAILPTIPVGWLCPRCGKVNAPDVRQCDCEPGRLPNTVVGPSETKAPVSTDNGA